MSGLLSPDPRLRELSDLGLVQAGALLHTYVSGTPSTPLATYSDVALTIPNANPIVASSGGLFGPIYLSPGVAYKYVLTDALGNPLWSQDPVTAPSSGYVDGSLIKAADGTVAAPGVTFNSDPDNGMYRDGTNGLSLATNGIKALGIDATQFVDSPTQPRARAFNNTTQSINNATLTVITFNSEDYDVGGMHDTGSNTGRMTIPTGGDGLYLIVGKVRFAANGTGNDRIARITKNGSSVGTQVDQPALATNNTTAIVPSLEVLAAGDYIELVAFQDSGGALNVGSTLRQDACELSIVKLW